MFNRIFSDAAEMGSVQIHVHRGGDLLTESTEISLVESIGIVEESNLHPGLVGPLTEVRATNPSH